MSNNLLPGIFSHLLTEAWERLPLELGDPTGMFPKRYQAGHSDFMGNHRHPEKKRPWRGFDPTGIALKGCRYNAFPTSLPNHLHG
jgi:hypothetical protein